MTFFRDLLPGRAAEGAAQVDHLLMTVHAGLLLILLVGGLLFGISLFRFRGSRQHDVSSLPSWVAIIQIGLLVLEAVLLLNLALPAWWKLVTKEQTERPSVRIKVIAQQFVWIFHYPGPDGIFGRTELNLVNRQTNLIGLDFEDIHAKDDMVLINECHVPVGQTVLWTLSSSDVVHSCSLPQMRVKRDVIPGMSTQLIFKPTKKGTYEIACAQLCGAAHYQMRGQLVVKNPTDYKTWLSSQTRLFQDQHNLQKGFWN